MALKMNKVPKGMKNLDMTNKKSESKPEPYVHDERPTIYFDSKQLPAIESWEAGKTYDLNLKVTMESKRMIMEKGKDQECRGEFRITHVGVDEDAATDKD